MFLALLSHCPDFITVFRDYTIMSVLKLSSHAFLWIAGYVTVNAQNVVLILCTDVHTPSCERGVDISN